MVLCMLVGRVLVRLGVRDGVRTSFDGVLARDIFNLPACDV